MARLTAGVSCLNQTHEDEYMTPEENLQTVRAELEAGIVLSKCQKCGCMDSALKHLAALLPSVGTEEAFGLTVSVAASLKNMRPVQYTC